MQVIKPDTLSLLHNTYGYNGQQFVVSAMSFFQLGENNNLLLENKQWTRLQPWLDEQLVLDTGYAKACGEILLAGTAYAPGGEAVAQMQVSVEVGNAVDGKIQKVVNVIGNRKLSIKGFMGTTKVSEAEPFTKMSLGFEQSYGGEGYMLNSQGKGAVKVKNSGADDNETFWPMPNLYLDGESIKPDKKPRTVASFLPLTLDHPKRMQLQGTYNQKWLDEVHPGFPDDTNPFFFNAAPSEQLLKGFFSPGQEYCLCGLHPEKITIEGKLPEVYVRAFVTQTERDGSENFKEIQTQIDTLWFFPELELGIAIHRGVLPAGDSAGLDIKNLLLALENIEDVPRDLSYFQKVRDLRLNKKTSMGNLFNATQLLPQLNSEEIQRRAGLFVDAQKELEQKRRTLREQLFKKLKAEQPDFDFDAAAIKAQKNKEQQSLDTLEQEPPPIPKELIEKKDFDLTPYLDWAKAQSIKAKSQIKKSLVALEKIKSETSFMPSEYEKDDAILSRINDVVLVTFFTKDKTPIDRETETTEEKITRVEKNGKIARRIGRQKAADFTAPVPMPEHAGKFIREQVIALLQKEESLIGRDLAGADLSGLEFKNVDFTDVMLEKANLNNAIFSNCKFDGAALTCAVLENTIMTQCSFVNANYSSVEACRASFNGCLFDHTCLMQCQFNLCDFSGAKFIKIQTMVSNWQQSVFNQAEFQAVQIVECNLKQTHWQGANLIQATLMQCDLQESDWQKATLFRCVMLKTQANKAKFCCVAAQRVQFSTEGDFTEAELSSGNWEQSGFRGLNLSQSNLSLSVFKSCDFGDADLSGARLTGTLFHNSLLFKVNFNNSDCTETVFHQSNLRKSQFKKALLTKARINQSNLREVLFEDCDTEYLQCSKAPSLT